MPRHVILLFIIVTMLGTSHTMYGHSLSLFSHDELGADYEELGYIGTARFLPYLAIPLFIGLLLDRINPRYLLVLGILLYSIPLLLITSVTSPTEVIMFQFVIGSAHAFIWPPAQSILSQDRRNRRKYVGRFMMFFMIGLALGTMVGSVILDMTETNYRLLLQLAGAVVLSSIVLAILVHPRIRRAKHEMLDVKSFRKILHFPLTISLVLFSTACFSMLFTIYPPFVHDRGLESSHILLLFTIYGTVRVGTMSIVHYLHNHAHKLMILCASLISVGMSVTVFASSFMDFVFAMIPLGIGISLIYPLGLDEILSHIDRRLTNKMIGAFECLVGLGWITGPLVGGYATHIAAGYIVPDEAISAPYWLFLVIGIVLSILLLVSYKRLDVKRQNTYKDWEAYSDDA